MGPEAVGAVVAAVAAFLLATRASGDAVQTMSGLFRRPDLGWPSGVQEDDDMHWSWTPGAAIPTPPSPVDADWQELDPATLRLPAQPLLRHRHP